MVDESAAGWGEPSGGAGNRRRQISPISWLSREVQLIASLGYLHEEFDFAMQLIADGRLGVASLHTRTVGLEELESAFRNLLAGGGDVKVLVDPRRS